MLHSRKRTLSLLLAAFTALLLPLLAACGGGDDAGDDIDRNALFVHMQIQNFGEIVVELYPDVAPVTVVNFQKLVREGFYDGLTFHRVSAGFVIQGGDPKGDSTGGSGNPILGEFALNGVENNLSHTRGVISMARSSSYNSASSQFFIVLSDSAAASLDGAYAAFGKVVSGMEVVDQIAACPTEGELIVGEPVVITSMTLAES